MSVRRIAVFGLILVLAGVSGTAAWLWLSLWYPQSLGTTDLTIEEGSTGREVLDMLEGAGLVPSPLAGRLYLRTVGRGRLIHFGHYRFAAKTRPLEALDLLLEGRVEMVAVTVLEGSDLADLATQMVGAGIGAEAEWSEIAQRVDWVTSVASEATSLQGFFFPDTYQFAVGTTVETAARHLVDRFLLVWKEESSAAGPTWGTPFEVTTLASLVEAETPMAEERARVAGVYFNRLRRGILLQCDPTVVFALKRRGEWTGRLLRIHWSVDDPYNTYRFPGLPPGPINSPGRASIRAALTPEEHGFLYFVASPDGGHVFSRTLAEHNRAVARWLRSRR